MKFSYQWLSEFVDIPCDADTLAEKLSLAGLEVEEVIYHGKNLCHIITGKIEKIEKHPDADRLVVCQITDGKKTHQIVTAATNVFEGAIVPVSLPGAILENGLKIKPTKMRGMPSNGMLCSEVELGLSDESKGIMILPEDTPLGVDFVSYARLQDQILDIGILPNRGDCQSIYGLAREISTLFNIPLKPINTKLKLDKKTSSLKLSVQDVERCPLYTARVIKNVSQNPSPDWMKKRLEISGIRPISLIVDITNYVLLEMGQPLHAFDASLIESKTIDIRSAKKKDVFTTLDGVKRHCDENTLLITDGKKGIALAGIMGGENSEISDKSSDVILESAYFDATTTRRTAVQFALRTESAIRFEKGVDVQGVISASDRAAHLLQELGGANVEEIQVIKDKKSPLFKEKTIAFELDKINTLLGTDISKKEMVTILEKLGLKIDKEKALIPSWRAADLDEMPCLAEEVARIYGIDELPSTLPNYAVTLDPAPFLTKATTTCENILIQRGFSQVNTFPMIAKDDFEHTKEAITDQTIEFQNPLSQDESILRHHLYPSLLKVLSHNSHRQHERIFLFEVGKVFQKHGDEIKEEWLLTALSYGPLNLEAYEEKEKDNNAISFPYLKGVFDTLRSGLKLDNIKEKKSENLFLHPVKSRQFTQGNKDIGYVGFLHPQITKAYGLNQEVGIITLSLSTINQDLDRTVSFKPFSKFPSTRRDIAILAPKDLPYEDISAFITKNKAKTVKKVFLFDLFESEKIGSDKKSLAFGCIYNAQDRTLSDDDVNKAHQKLCKKIRDELGVIIR